NGAALPGAPVPGMGQPGDPAATPVPGGATATVPGTDSNSQTLSPAPGTTPTPGITPTPVPVDPATGLPLNRATAASTNAAAADALAKGLVVKINDPNNLCEYVEAPGAPLAAAGPGMPGAPGAPGMPGARSGAAIANPACSTLASLLSWECKAGEI